MEIAGYPHFENSCSNILQFYLNPNNEHGFGTLLLDYLATLINTDLVTNEQSIEVRREELTDRRNRIDLVIESDDYIIGIENKIFAMAYNPFCDYSKYIGSLSRGRQVHKVLLSLRLEQPFPELCGFKPICYDLFLKEISAKLDSYSQSANEQHITFLQDFIKTMQNLQHPTSIEPQRIEYFQNHHQDITTLLSEVDDFRKHMRRKTKQLEKIIAADTNISPSFPKLHFWQSPRFLIDALTCTIEPDFFPLAFAICLTSKGWNLQFWNQNSKNNDINRHEETKNWFKERGVEVKDIPQYDGNVWRLEYEGKNYIQPYDTDSENIKILILDIWKRLNKNTNSTIEQKN